MASELWWRSVVAFQFGVDTRSNEDQSYVISSNLEAIMAQSYNRIQPRLRTWKAKQKLKNLYIRAKSKGDLAVWRRCKAVLEYLKGKSVIDIAKGLDAGRSSVYEWLDFYDALGPDGLRTSKPPGAECRLTEKQQEELGKVIEDGPVAAGYSTGVWTGPMIGDMIRKRFGVVYHNHHIPRLLHRLGFSVQRPRKRLARADAEAQAYWLRTKLPRIKKKRRPVEE
jgi:transposase